MKLFLKVVTVLIMILVSCQEFSFATLETPNGFSAGKADIKGGRDPWHNRARYERTNPGEYVKFEPRPDRFCLVSSGKAAPLVVNEQDFPGVVRVVGDLQTDIERVSQVKPPIASGQIPPVDEVVLVGTIGKSPLIDNLVSSGKLDVNQKRKLSQKIIKSMRSAIYCSHKWAEVYIL